MQQLKKDRQRNLKVLNFEYEYVEALNLDEARPHGTKVRYEKIEH